MQKRGKPSRKPKGNAKPRRNPQTLSVQDRKALDLARRLSKTFHGNAQVIELSEKERKLPRFMAVAGKLGQLEYEPVMGSKREGKIYVHKSGDKGPFRNPSKRKPVLAIDPISKRPVIVPHGSPLKASKGWLVG